MVGLGNPGEKYRWNRHNVGFLFLDHLAGRLAPGGWKGRSKFGGEVVDGRLAARRVYLFKPLSFMNLSGGPVARAAGFFSIPAERILVCVDDVALRFGSFRVRSAGSAGGQKGLVDVIRSLGTEAVPRFRFGVGMGDRPQNLAGYVLGDFGKAEREALPGLFDHAAAALETFLVAGPDAAASKFNITVREPGETAGSAAVGKGRVNR